MNNLESKIKQISCLQAQLQELKKQVENRGGFIGEVPGYVNEVDTLQLVTDRGNATTNSIKLVRNYDSDADRENSVLEIANIGNNTSDQSNLIISDFIDEFKQGNPDAFDNTIIGFGNSTLTGNSSYNTIVGNYAINLSGVENSKLSQNTIVGAYNFINNSRLQKNTIIGSGNRIANQDYRTTPDASYLPIWDKLINGGANDNAWGNIYRSFDNRNKYKNYLVTENVIDEDGKQGPFHNVVIGHNLGPNFGRLSPSNMYQSIWIGSNVFNGNFSYKFVGNIFLGNEIYADHPHDRPAGAIVIGNYLRVAGRHTVGELAIHSSTHTPTHWDSALIRGNFNNRYLKINGRFLLNRYYLETYNKDTFNKVLVAKEDGNVSLADFRPTPDIRVLHSDYIPNGEVDIDKFSFNIRGNSTYKVSIGILGDVGIVGNHIITNDRGKLSGINPIYAGNNVTINVISESDFLQNITNIQRISSILVKSIILEFIIRPTTDCTIKIPIGSFEGSKPNSKLLAGTYVSVEKII